MNATAEIVRTYAVAHGWRHGFKASNMPADLQIPAGLLPISAWGYDYASSVDVFRLPDGRIVLDCQGRTSSGWEADWHRIAFANAESFDAWKREVAYIDREHRMPGVNPNRVDWQRVEVGK